ncbi:zf-HC2 domain-containing protein [Streptomyces sp. NPDC013178]|uniref:zf-HC2 domain-containing protein n=1 Tax=unclassified Streptomyces TaxID=2593676 RepID=UPI0033E3FB65
MSTDHWHTSDDLAARYADGTLPEADAWSLEKHLERCGTCAQRVSAAVRRLPAPALVLAEVREAVLAQAAEAVPAQAVPGEVRELSPVPTDAVSGGTHAPSPVLAEAVVPGETHAPSPVPGRTEPGGTRAPSPPVPPLPAGPRARLWSSFLGRALWAAGPAVRGAWLPAVLLVALGALALAYGAGVDGARPLLLAAAPVVPVLGVALSYGPHADPLHEITAATPSGGLRLLLTRTVAVLAVSLPLLTLAGLLLPASGAPGAAAWLLPGLALTLATLALAGYVGCRVAAAVTGGGWLCAVPVPALVSSADAPLTPLTAQLSLFLEGPLAQGAWAAAAVLCAAALAARRTAYRPERP